MKKKTETSEHIALLVWGDSLEKLKELKDSSIDSVVTDPPYGLSFMGKKWDYDVPSVELWREVLRVLKPGGHLLSFGGTRTYHRMVVNIEDAGFEIRDQIMWIYGSGFPKSLDVSKAIDKAAGATREKLKRTGKTFTGSNNNIAGITGEFEVESNIPITATATAWQGWGTALKPANEPIVLARKPIEKGLTVAENVLKWGCGGLNIDGTRIAHNEECKPMKSQVVDGEMTSQKTFGNGGRSKDTLELKPNGRWPANVLFDEDAAELINGSCGQDVARFFFVCGQEKIKDAGTFAGKKTASKSECLNIAGFGSNTTAQYLMGTTSITKTETNLIITFPILNASKNTLIGTCIIESEKIIRSLTASSIESVSVVSNTEALINLVNEGQVLITGTVSLALPPISKSGARKTANTITPICESTEKNLRAFYIAKASKRERNAGLEGMPERAASGLPMRSKDGERGGEGLDGTATDRLTKSANHHPTVKPIRLMEYLIKLVTPPNGQVLDPFMGSGSTGCAAVKLGFNFIGIEREQEYVEIAKRRIEHWKQEVEETCPDEKNQLTMNI